jgi:hypothetical protein
MRCPSCQSENPAGARFCGQCGAPVAETTEVMPVVAPIDDAVVDLANNADLASGSGPSVLPRPPHLQAFVDAAVPRLAQDPRLVGVAAAGSWISGHMDAYSDVDLWLAVAPGHEAEVANDRRAIAASLGPPLLAAFTGEHVGEPRLLICLYATEPLAHVDLKFVALADLAVRVEDPVILWERDGQMARAMAGSKARYPGVDAQWLEDRFWIWAHYAAAKIGRGELFEALGFLGFVRERVLGPMLLTLEGQRPAGVRRVEQYATSAALAELRATIAAHDARSCAAALAAAVRMYRRLREQLAAPGLERRGAAEAAVVAYVAKLPGATF